MRNKIEIGNEELCEANLLMLEEYPDTLDDINTLIIEELQGGDDLTTLTGRYKIREILYERFGLDKVDLERLWDIKQDCDRCQMNKQCQLSIFVGKLMVDSY